MGKARIHFRELLQRIPCRLFTDGHIGIIGLRLFAVRRIRHAHRQPCRHQRKNRRNFLFLERKSAVIARNDFRCRPERIRFSENCVGGGDGCFGNRQPVVHVAKINHARDLARLRPRIAHQHVVIVGIPINHASPQARAREDFGFIKCKELFDQRPPRGPSNLVDVLLDPDRA